MRILVSDTTGPVGAGLKPYLESPGREVVALVRTPAGGRRAARVEQGT
jgi:uncharacterized protein YbjT (DUF2867 family)